MPPNFGFDDSPGNRRHTLLLDLLLDLGHATDDGRMD
jgi:hypothetical protein